MVFRGMRRPEYPACRMMEGSDCGLHQPEQGVPSKSSLSSALSLATTFLVNAFKGFWMKRKSVIHERRLTRALLLFLAFCIPCRELYSMGAFSALLFQHGRASMRTGPYGGVLQVFSYFIKSCYHFIKLLALVLILLKQQEQGEPLYLLIIHTFKVYAPFQSVIISSRCFCLSMRFYKSLCFHVL